MGMVGPKDQATPQKWAGQAQAPKMVRAGLMS